MKKTTTTLALLAVLSLANTSCQKEDLRNSTTRETTEQAYAENGIVYSIDGQTYTASFISPVDGHCTPRACREHSFIPKDAIPGKREGDL